MATAQDTFDGPDLTNSLGPDWTFVIGTWNRTNNLARTNATGTSHAVRVPEFDTDNNKSRVQIPGTGGSSMGVTARVGPAGENCYLVRVNASSPPQMAAFRMVNGTPTQVGASVSITRTGGEYEEIQVSTDPDGNVRIKGLWKDVVVLEVVDTNAARILTGKRAGIRVFGNSMPLDNWSGGDLAAAVDLRSGTGAALNVTVAQTAGSGASIRTDSGAALQTTIANTAGTGTTTRADSGAALQVAVGNATGSGLAQRTGDGAGLTTDLGLSTGDGARISAGTGGSLHFTIDSNTGVGSRVSAGTGTALTTEWIWESVSGWRISSSAGTSTQTNLAWGAGDGTVVVPGGFVGANLGFSLGLASGTGSRVSAGTGTSLFVDTEFLSGVGWRSSFSQSLPLDTRLSLGASSGNRLSSNAGFALATLLDWGLGRGTVPGAHVNARVAVIEAQTSVIASISDRMTQVVAIGPESWSIAAAGPSD